MIFRRGRGRKEVELGVAGEMYETDQGFDTGPDDVEPPDEPYAEVDEGEAAEPETAATERDGPWDVADDAPAGERVDLGSIQVPVDSGLEIQVRIEDDQVVAANVLHGDSALELMAFAAPKSGGIWEDVRGEMIKGLKESGGRVSSVDGTFGRELVAEVPVEGPDGQRGLQHVRFVGVDGPRWFLRAAFSGRAVDEPRQAEALERVLRGTVVNRGQEAMAPRELIPMELPREARQALGLTEAEDQPVERFKAVRRAPARPGDG